MKKVVVYGWIPKWGSALGCIDHIEGCVEVTAVGKKGKRVDWNRIDWPPKKVKITVEEVDDES